MTDPGDRDAALALAAHRYALGYITRRDLLSLAAPGGTVPVSYDLATVEKRFALVLRQAGVASVGAGLALERELRTLAGGIRRGERLPVAGAAAAWRLVLAQAGAQSHALRTWFARTPEQAATLLAPPPWRELVRLGRECALLDAGAWRDDLAHPATIVDLAARVTQAVQDAITLAPDP